MFSKVGLIVHAPVRVNTVSGRKICRQIIAVHGYAMHASLGLAIRAHADIIGHAHIEYIGKYQSCMVYNNRLFVVSAHQ